MRRLTLLVLVLAAVIGILAQKEGKLLIKPSDRTLMDGVMFDTDRWNLNIGSDSGSMMIPELDLAVGKPSLDMFYFYIGMNRNNSMQCYNPDGPCMALCCIMGCCLPENCICGCNPTDDVSRRLSGSVTTELDDCLRKYMSWRTRGSYVEVTGRADFSHNVINLIGLATSAVI